MIKAYIYYLDDTYIELTDLIISLKYKCSVDKPCQEVTLVIPYSVYSTAYPSIPISTGLKLELYEGEDCVFRGKTETVTTSFDEEKMTITCYDYIRILMKSKVTYNFQKISAFSAVCQIFNDLKIPYSEGGILGGDDEKSSGKMVEINHIIKQRSAYEACMMIATELYTQFKESYYVFMDVGGNVNIMECDRYWAGQTVEPCTNPSLPDPDGNILTAEYKEDASDIITQVAMFNSKGGKVDVNGNEEISEDDEGSDD